MKTTGRRVLDKIKILEDKRPFQEPEQEVSGGHDDDVIVLSPMKIPEVERSQPIREQGNSPPSLSSFSSDITPQKGIDNVTLAFTCTVCTGK